MYNYGKVSSLILFIIIIIFNNYIILNGLLICLLSHCVADVFVNTDTLFFVNVLGNGTNVYNYMHGSCML